MTLDRRPALAGAHGARDPACAAFAQVKLVGEGVSVSKLDVNPADLRNVAEQYTQLQTAAASLGPQAVDEVSRIIASHGAMGYPVAVGVVAGLARRQAALEKKAADFGTYATRFQEHAASYELGDREGAELLRDREGEPDTKGEVQAVSNDIPLSPADDPDPPHGKDPRYWIDASKLIHVPDGELAPYGTQQVGPNLWYPSNDSHYRVVPPPPPAEYPFDASDVVVLPSDELGPTRSIDIVEQDGSRYWIPDPAGGYAGSSPWPAPEVPIDVRDVLYVPPGELAPSGYVEYLPNWWAPKVDQ